LLERILVPTDGSPESGRALSIAEHIAVAHGTEVVLVQVVQFPVLTGGYDWSSPELYEQLTDAQTQDAQANLDRLAARFRSVGLRVTPLLLRGSPAISLLEVEKEQNPGLVVMSTHGRTGLARFALGSVADRVVREGTVPVLLVRAAPSSGLLKTALVMLDGSAVADAVLPAIEMLAGQTIEEAKLFRAVVASADRGPARTYLEGVATRLARSGLKTEVLVDVGDPTMLIERAAREADLVVLSTHGRSGFDRLRHGSVAERVVRQIDKPVLLVRSPA
jgi:nucleotide-binding universal stress UspA family protein